LHRRPGGPGLKLLRQTQQIKTTSKLGTMHGGSFRLPV
jgi:hypothetical protein